MKILVTSLPDLKRIFVQRPHHLISYLSQNHDVTVVCTRAWWLEEKTDDYLKQIIENIQISYSSNLKIPTIGQELLSASSINPTISNSFLSKFDVHINFHSLISGYMRTTKLKALGIPSIFDICDDLVEWIHLSPQVPFIFKSVGRAMTKVLLKKIALKSAKITYTSKSLLKSEWIESASKLKLIPNGVNTTMFIPKPDNGLRMELGIKEKDIVIGFVGALQEWIDLEPIFIAINETTKDIENFKILIVGSGSKLEDNKKLAQKYLHNNTAIFLGYIPYESIPLYIACMDICVLPFTEGKVSQGALPLKLFEYMSCAKPIVSTPLSAVEEAVGNSVLYASSVENYKQAILYLARESGLRAKMGQEGRQLVQQNFSWDRICREFEQVILEEVN